jgi:predicted aspartyl protease
MTRFSSISLGCACVAVALMAIPATPTASAQCRPRHLVDLPVNLAQGLPLVLVSSGRRGMTLILDTGAEQSILSRTVVERLGLQPYRAYQRTMRGPSGSVGAETVDLPLAAGGIPLPNHGVLVGSLSLPTLGETEPPDGLLGADLLSNFEVDLDLPHGLLHLYEKPACEITAPAWALRYEVIPANRSLHDHLFFKLILDGTSLAAFFDSGTQHSLVDERSARQVGVDDTVLGQDPASTVRGINAATAPAHIHRFVKLIVGGEALAHPELVVTKLGLNDADVILGTDYLRSHRVWLSYGSHQVFFQTGP